MDMQELIAYRDRLIRAGEDKNRRIRRLERLVKGQRRTIAHLSKRISTVQGSKAFWRDGGRSGQLYAHISEALGRLVFDDVNGAAETLARALRLTDEELDDLVYKARLRQEAQRSAERPPNAIRGPGTNRMNIKPSKRRKVFERDGHRCRMCGAVGGDENPLTIDHVVPLSHGGTNEQRNLQSLCLTCNMRKNRHEALPNEPIDLDKYEIRIVPKHRGRFSPAIDD
jgi:5-methylcytosine-specific restriction enzyme A